MSDAKYRLTEDKCRRIHAYLEENLSDAQKLAFYYQNWLLAGLSLQMHHAVDGKPPADEPLASYEDLTNLEKTILGICQDLQI